MTDEDVNGLVARLRNDADVLLAPAVLTLPAPHLSTRLTQAADRLVAQAADLTQLRDALSREREAVLELEVHAHTARKLLDAEPWTPTHLLWARLTGHLERAVDMLKGEV